MTMMMMCWLRDLRRSSDDERGAKQQTEARRAAQPGPALGSPVSLCPRGSSLGVHISISSNLGPRPAVIAMIDADKGSRD